MEDIVWLFFFPSPFLVNDSGESIRKRIQENDDPEENLSLLEKHSCLQEKSKIKFSEVPT